MTDLEVVASVGADVRARLEAVAAASTPVDAGAASSDFAAASAVAVVGSAGEGLDDMISGHGTSASRLATAVSGTYRVLGAVDDFLSQLAGGGG